MTVPSQKRSGRGLEYALSNMGPQVKRALLASHAKLQGLGIPHVLIGGIAVGAHGYVYATTDVDWLVYFDGRGVMSDPNALVSTIKPGVPLEVSGVNVDYVSIPNTSPVFEHADKLLHNSTTASHVHVADEEFLVYSKLDVGRMKDKAAVVELLKVGMDAEHVEKFLLATGNSNVILRWYECKRQFRAER